MRTVSQISSVASFLVPAGLLVKAGILGLSYFGRKIIDKKVEKTLSSKIKETIGTMLIIATVNLTIVLISTYLIINQIIFW